MMENTFDTIWDYLEAHPYPASTDPELICKEVCENLFDIEFTDLDAEDSYELCAAVIRWLDAQVPEDPTEAENFMESIQSTIPMGKLTEGKAATEMVQLKAELDTLAREIQETAADIKWAFEKYADDLEMSTYQSLNARCDELRNQIQNLRSQYVTITRERYRVDYDEYEYETREIESKDPKYDALKEQVAKLKAELESLDDELTALIADVKSKWKADTAEKEKALNDKQAVEKQKKAEMKTKISELAAEEGFNAILEKVKKSLGKGWDEPELKFIDIEADGSVKFQLTVTKDIEVGYSDFDEPGDLADVDEDKVWEDVFDVMLELDPSIEELPSDYCLKYTDDQGHSFLLDFSDSGIENDATLVETDYWPATYWEPASAEYEIEGYVTEFCDIEITKYPSEAE